MRTRITLAALTALLTLCAIAPAADAAFGISSFSAQVRKSAAKDDLQTQAGSHPFVGVTDFTFNNNGLTTDGNVKNVRVDLPAGLVSNPEATPKCTDAQFPSCPPATKLGTEELYVGPPAPITADVFNMVPKPGQISDFAFNTVLGRTDIVGGLRYPGDYGLYFTISDIPQSANLTRSVLTFYGVPADQNGGGGPKTPFITLPTFCGPPQTTKLTAESYAGETATAGDTTPTGATGCDKLPFAPVFSASTSSKVSKTNGAGLSVKLTQALGESNTKSVSVLLPKQFAARLDTVQLACPEATFKADPKTCPAASMVGTTAAATPLLPTKLAGIVYMVGHTGTLPTLEAVLKGGAVTVDLSGTIVLGTGITSTFGSIPDLPITEFTLSLPSGPHSALGSSSDLCAVPLVMPTTIVSQSGKTVDQQTAVTVPDCGVAILASKVKGRTATLTLRVPGSGSVKVTGKLLKGVKRTTAAGRATVKLSLTKKGAAVLRSRQKHHKALPIRVTARFTPTGGAGVSKALATVRFK